MRFTRRMDPSTTNLKGGINLFKQVKLFLIVLLSALVNSSVVNFGGDTYIVSNNVVRKINK